MVPSPYLKGCHLHTETLKLFFIIQAKAYKQQVNSTTSTHHSITLTLRGYLIVSATITSQNTYDTISKKISIGI